MRVASLVMIALWAACGRSVPMWSPERMSRIPLRIFGDGERGVVLSCSDHVIVRPLQEPTRVVDVAEWRAMCAACAGGLSRAADEPITSFEDDYVVAVPLGTGLRCKQVVVSSEEGVDVVTVDVEDRAEQAAERSGVAILLLGRRPNQLAVVVRDQQRGRERTAAVYSPE